MSTGNTSIKCERISITHSINRPYRRRRHDPRNMYERSALNYLIYNAPMEYVELFLSGEIEEYLRKCTDYSRLD